MLLVRTSWIYLGTCPPGLLTGARRAVKHVCIYYHYFGDFGNLLLRRSREFYTSISWIEGVHEGQNREPSGGWGSFLLLNEAISLQHHIKESDGGAYNDGGSTNLRISTRTFSML